MKSGELQQVKIHHITTVSQSLGFLRGQLTFMRERGFRVVVSSRPDERLNEFALNEGVEAIGVPMNRQVSPLADIASIRCLVRAMRHHKPYIVHAHTPKGGLLGVIAGRIARVPIVIYHIRGLPYVEMHGAKRMLMITTERISCALAHRVLCVSHSVKEIAIQDGLVSADKIMVPLQGSGNGVDSQGRFNPDSVSSESLSELRAELGIPEDATVVLFVGRLAKDKGIRELTAAWETISATHPSARLVVVGDLDERDPAPPSVVETLRADDSVLLAGKRKDTSVFYGIADIVVLPTYREGFPNVLLEASSMAKAIVATDVPGCIDAVEDGVTGDLVRVRDSAALANAIAALIDDPARREAYGLAGRERVVKYFDSRRIWEAILAEYNRLVSGHTQ